MGKSYCQLSLRERVQIDLLLGDGLSVSAVARRLGRARSTISREVKRNSRRTKAWAGGYDGERAHGLALRRRRWGEAEKENDPVNHFPAERFKLARQPALARLARDRLAMGWSPEQIAGRLALEHGRTIISHESIYRFVYHRSAQKDWWHRLLPKARHRRGPPGRRGGSPVETIRRRVGLAERPASVADRRETGHWEGDLMLFSRYGQAALVTHERSSRIVIVTRMPGKAAEPVADRLVRQFSALPPAARRSITFDNGTEFARHDELTDRIEMPTYFCDPRKPWQKGGIENAIGRLRRPLPRKTDLDALTLAELDRLVARYNRTPRKCLGFNTPAEAFFAQLEPLHFNRESTSPPACCVP